MITFQEWLGIKENDMKFQKDFAMAVDQQLGGNKDVGAASKNPKLVVNKAAIQAAKSNPAAAAKMLNADSQLPGMPQQQQPQKMKKRQSKK